MTQKNTIVEQGGLNYEAKQEGKSITEYCTQMRVLWEEPESLYNLPPITTMTTEIYEFITALNAFQQGKRLFQFLNGLDEVYGGSEEPYFDDESPTLPGSGL